MSPSMPNGYLDSGEDHYTSSYVRVNGDTRSHPDVPTMSYSPKQTRTQRLPANGEPPQKAAPIIKASDGYRKMLKAMGQLRVFDQDREFSLPQLVVCGEQSAGKSSVLEAISGATFPRKGGGKCTRFVTIVNLWPVTNESGPERIEAVLQPRGAKRGQEKFRETIKSLTELEGLIERASQAMRLGDTRGDTQSVAEFSTDILTVDVWAHDATPLSLVDLPGIINSGGTGSVAATGTDRKLVDMIVEDWISDPNSIILAVVDTPRDAENHGIFERAGRVDPDESRTMGIITKPDLIERGQARQKRWVQIALNQSKDFNLSLGWHILRNRNELELSKNDPLRDQTEKTYFEDPEEGWQSIVEESKRSPKTCGYGIDQLKPRLSALLERQTRLMLPKIQQQIQEKLGRLDADIKKLGIDGIDIEKAKDRFSDCCDKMCDLAKDGVAGHYVEHFSVKSFNLNNLSAGATCFVRSNVRKEDKAFARRLREEGHDPFFAWGHLDQSHDPDTWVDRVHMVLDNTEGMEPQNTTDPARISLLFHHYSDKWYEIAKDYVQSVYKTCEIFLDWVVDKVMKEHPAFESLSSAVKVQQIRPIMRDRLARAMQELEKLEKDRKRPIRTVNRLYREMSKKHDNDRIHQLVQRAMDSRDRSALNESLWLKPTYLAESVGLATHSDVRREQAAKAITSMLTHYQIAIESFIDNVVLHVVERHLLDDIKDVFSKLARKDKDAIDKIWHSGNEEFEKMQRRSQELSEERATLTALYDDLSTA